MWAQPLLIPQKVSVSGLAEPLAQMLRLVFDNIIRTCCSDISMKAFLIMVNHFNRTSLYSVQVSNRRMVDYVPLTISLHMIENLYKDIRLEVPVMTTEENTIQLAKEDNRIVSERKNLQQKLERLELAHHELTAY